MSKPAWYWQAADKAAKHLPADWTAERGKYCYHLQHKGVAMNPQQWITPGTWYVDTVERKQECRTRFIRADSAHALKPVTVFLDGKLTVETGPWQVKPQPGEPPLVAGIRWVQEQEKAVKQYGSR